MKRQIQKPGVRKWYGEHFIELQSEPLKAIDAMASTLGACVISGCEIQQVSGQIFDISPGVVVLPCEDGKMRIMPYSGDTNMSGFNEEMWLIATKTEVTGEYQNPASTLIAYDYKAQWEDKAPVYNGLYKAPYAQALPRFIDLIKNNLASVFEPIFAKNTAFNKDFGQGQNQVERGSNNPSGLIIRKIDIGEWNIHDDSYKQIDLSPYNIGMLIGVDVSIRFVDNSDGRETFEPLLSEGKWSVENSYLLYLKITNDDLRMHDGMPAGENRGYVVLRYLQEVGLPNEGGTIS